MKEQIGKRLRDLRMGIHMTQAELAKTVGTQQSTINRYEQGQSVPSPEVFVRYADYFDVSMDYLYCRTDDPRGKMYQYQPEALMERAKENQEMKDFIEMCFDPKSPVNGRLKEALFNMLKEAGEK